VVEADGRRAPGPAALRQQRSTATAERLPRQIRILVVAAFLIAIGFGIVAPTLPVFVRSFDVGVTAVSLAVSIFALSRLLFAPLGGRFVTRYGELPVYLAGLGILSLATAGCGFAVEYWQLLVLRVLAGIGSTMFTVSALSMLIGFAPETMRGRATGLWATGFLLGNIVGPLVGGALLVVSLRAAFVVYAVVLLVVVGASALLLRPRRGSAEVVVEVPPARFRDAFGHAAYRAALVASFANGWAVFGVRIALVPLLVVEVLGRSESWAGIALAVFAVGNAATLTVTGRLTDRIGRRPPMLVGLAVSAVTTACLGLIDSAPLFLAVSLLAGAGSGLVNPPMNAAVADVIGSGARGGSVLAGFQMAADTGAIIGPIVAGALAEGVGFSAAFGVTGAVAVIALVFWVRAPETLVRRTVEEADPPTTTVEVEREAPPAGEGARKPG
jgi:DHA1 family tetracycline resistance protein-like MFS transporter